MKAVKKGLTKLTSKFGFGNRKNVDLLDDFQNSVIEQPEVVKLNDQDPVELRPEELNDRIENFKIYLSTLVGTETGVSGSSLSQINLPNDLVYTVFLSVISNSHLLIDTSHLSADSILRMNSSQTGQCHHDTGRVLAALVPLMSGLRCGYVSCTTSTTSEELVQQLFVNNAPVSTPSSLRRRSSRISQTTSIPRSSSPQSTTPLRHSNAAVPDTSPGLEKVDEYKMVDVFVVDDIDVAPLPTRYTLLQMMTMRKVAYRGVTVALPEYFNIVCTVEAGVNGMEDEDDESSLSPLMLDNFLINYRLLETISLPKLQTNYDPLLASKESRYILPMKRTIKLRECVSRIHIAHDIAQYIRSIVVSLRNHPLVTHGPSPRATPTMTLAAKTLALLSGKKFVTPTHVSIVAKQVLNHRIFLYNLNAADVQQHQQSIAQAIRPPPPVLKRKPSRSISPQPFLLTSPPLPTTSTTNTNEMKSQLSKATLLPPPPFSITSSVESHSPISPLPSSLLVNSLMFETIDSFNIIIVILQQITPPI